MRLQILALGLASLCVPGASASAQQPPPVPTLPGGGPNGQPQATIIAEPVALMIAACDADSDAKVTKAELAACVKRSFASIDTGNSGSIGYIGYSDWALMWLGDRNALPSPFTVDADGDNRITLAELEAQFDTLFTRFDVNKDGSLTRAELLTIKAMGVGERPTAGRGKRGAKPAGQ